MDIEITRLAVILIGIAALGFFAFQYLDFEVLPGNRDFTPTEESIDYLSIPWEEYLIGVWEITNEGHQKRQHKFSEPDVFYLIDMEHNPGEVLVEASWSIHEADLERAHIDLEIDDSTEVVSDMRLIRTSYNTYQLAYADVVLSTWRRVPD